MILLVEGVDCSGKSTLIKNFVDLSGMPVYKNTIKPTKASFDKGFVNGQYYGAYEALRKSNTDMIFDRSHLTEMAYAKIKRGYHPKKDFWYNYEEMNSHWMFIVYVDTPLDTVAERFEAEKEDYVKQSEIVGITEAYAKYLKYSKLGLIHINGALSRQRMLSQLVIQLNNLHVWTSRRQR